MTPIEVRLDEKEQTIRVTVRKYSPEQEMFMDTYIQKLAVYGYIKPSPIATWQSAPCLIPKGKDRYRVPTGLPPVNTATIGETWLMPNLEAELAEFAGKKCFGTIDFCNAYWQIHLDEDS